MGVMSTYVRPDIDAPVFRKVNGQVITYGDRWGGGSPPEDTYSVETHPERFLPLHTIADALIAHLIEMFDVEVNENLAFAADLLHARADVIRAVRVNPNDARSAGLTFVFTSYPSVIIHAGLLHDLLYPVCGCDACDESWEAQAEEMEWQVHAIVEGRYWESIDSGLSPWIEYKLSTPDGGYRSGRSRAEDTAKERIRGAKRILKGLPDGWSTWPVRPR